MSKIDIAAMAGSRLSECSRDGQIDDTKSMGYPGRLPRARSNAKQGTAKRHPQCPSVMGLPDMVNASQDRTFHKAKTSPANALLDSSSTWRPTKQVPGGLCCLHQSASVIREQEVTSLTPKTRDHVDSSYFRCSSLSQKQVAGKALQLHLRQGSLRLIALSTPIEAYINLVE